MTKELQESVYLYLASSRIKVHTTIPDLFLFCFSVWILSIKPRSRLSGKAIHLLSYLPSPASEMFESHHVTLLALNSQFSCLLSLQGWDNSFGPLRLASFHGFTSLLCRSSGCNSRKTQGYTAGWQWAMNGT